jgi:hypothetical protein
VIDGSGTGRVFGFAQLALAGVDPFAVRAAERELAELGVRIERRDLAAHYLVTGQLQTLVARLRAISAERRESEWRRALAEDLIEHGREPAAGFDLPAPAMVGWLYPLVGLVLLSVAAFAIWTASPQLLRSALPGLAGAWGAIVLISIVYAQVGRRWGRHAAQNAALLLLAVLVLGVLIYFRRPGRL